MKLIEPNVGNKNNSNKSKLFFGEKDYINYHLERSIYNDEESIKNEVTLQFTKNEPDIEQYCELRKNMYKNSRGDSAGMGGGKIDEFDNADNRNSHILTVKDGNKCIGGLRLITTYPNNRIALPSEDDEYTFDSSLPELSLYNKSYGEISRFVLLPEYRLYTKDIFKTLTEKALSLNLDFSFAIATDVRARIFKRLLKEHKGVKTYVKKNVILPKIYRSLKHSRSICVFENKRYCYPLTKNNSLRPIKLFSENQKKALNKKLGYLLSVQNGGMSYISD